jgi:hypothetical protein
LGHDVTPVKWTDQKWKPPGVYDAVVSIQHLRGIDDAMDDSTIKIIRTSMSDRVYHNNIIRQRTDQANARRNTNSLEYHRLLSEYDDPHWSLDAADHILVLGNETVKNTYPKEYHEKMTLHDTSAANRPDEVVRRNWIPEQRSFLYHAGSGAIHKGLDLCLEAFAKHPDWTLHVTSNLNPEPDFLKEFTPEFMMPNIHYHGWVVVQSRLFQKILNECYVFIMPTCSEAQSPATATCMSLGLYPIISKFTGHDLLEGCGIELPELTVEAVEQAVLSLPDDDELLRQVKVIQENALHKYSQERFRNTMMKHLRDWL